MAKIPQELAERLYTLYEATLMAPVPFDEWDGDKMRKAFERGIVKPEEQLLWLYRQQAQSANPEEPYDLGFLNALALAMHIFAGREPKLTGKPEGVAKLKKREKSAKTKFDKLKNEKDGAIRTLEKNLKEQKGLVRELKAEIKKKKK